MFVQETEIVATARVGELTRSIVQLRGPASVLGEGAAFLIKAPEIIAAVPVAGLTYSIVQLCCMCGIFLDTAPLIVLR